MMSAFFSAGALLPIKSPNEVHALYYTVGSHPPGAAGYRQTLLLPCLEHCVIYSKAKVSPQRSLATLHCVLAKFPQGKVRWGAFGLMEASLERNRSSVEETKSEAGAEHRPNLINH